jgi:hypothetical protein
VCAVKRPLAMKFYGRTFSPGLANLFEGVCPLYFKEQNKVLEPSIIIINYYIINSYNCIMNL